MGISLCPCDGSLTPGRYSRVVDQIIDGLNANPQLLLDPLAVRMERLATERRYEEAAWTRDRHRALVRALEARSRWRSLASAGLIDLEDREGRRVLIDHGRLSEPGLFSQVHAIPSRPDIVTEVPPSVEAAEEAAVLWRWLTGGSLRLVDTTGLLASPTRQPTPLTTLAA